MDLFPLFFTPPPSNTQNYEVSIPRCSIYFSDGQTEEQTHPLSVWLILSRFQSNEFFKLIKSCLGRRDNWESKLKQTRQFSVHWQVNPGNKVGISTAPNYLEYPLERKARYELINLSATRHSEPRISVIQQC